MLEYFENIVEDYSSPTYHRKWKEELRKDYLKEEIRVEAKTIISYLRGLYYSEKSTSVLEDIFVRIGSGLFRLKKRVEENIYKCEQELVKYNSPKFMCLTLENYYEIYDEIYNLLYMLGVEFGVKLFEKDIALSYNVKRKTLFDIREDHLRLLRSIELNKNVPDNIIEKYDLKINPESVDNITKRARAFRNERFEDYHYFSELNTAVIDYKFADFAEEFMMNNIYYVDPTGYDYMNRRWYVKSAQYIKKEVSKIKSVEKKIETVVDFAIHVSLCDDLLMEYFEVELLKIRKGNNDNSLKLYLKHLEERIIRIKSSPKYIDYRRPFALRNTTPITTRLIELINRYKVSLNDCVQAEDSELVLDDIANIKKIDFTDDVELFGQLIRLLEDNKLIKLQSRANAFKVLSKVFKADSKDFVHGTLGNAYYNKEGIEKKKLNAFQDKLQQIYLDSKKIKKK
ncbi:MAG: hypothetical protein JEZ14_12300 [Marinilabiliaceae bacterium]|nr:hypothetical protein [Marinilabiliaceae bacterium]